MNELLLIESLYAEFLFNFVRVFFFIAFAPVFSASKNIKLKIGAATTITVMLMMILPPGKIPSDALPLVWFVITEALIGLSLAMILKIAFAVTEVAGHAMSQSGGLSFAVTADPQNGAQIPVLGNFLSVVAILLFLSIDGLGMAIHGLTQTYRDLPPGNLPSLLSITAVWQYSSTIFTTSFLIALPIVTAVTMANLAFGIMTRTAPQINILAIGLPISLSITIIMVYFGMEGFVMLMQELFYEAITLMGGLYGR